MNIYKGFSHHLKDLVTIVLTVYALNTSFIGFVSNLKKLLNQRISEILLKVNYLLSNILLQIAKF